MISLVTVTRDNCNAYLPGILEIENLSFPTPWSLGSFLQEIKNPISQLWVSCAADGTVSGYTCFWMFASEIQLIHIATHPDRRNLGLGYQFLTRMVERGVANGMQQVWLEVRVSNLTAQRLYRKIGFREVGRRPRYYRDSDEDALIMSLALTDKVHYRRLSN